MKKKPRILIGLSEVAGHYKGLKQGFEALGLECTFINLSEHPFGFSADDKVWPVQWVQKADTNRRRHRGFSKLLLTILQIALQAVLFFRLLPRHDIFIYCANRSFMAFVDLLILRIAGKKIIYQMHGCDSRAPYFDGAYNEAQLLSAGDLYRRTRLKKWILRITEAFAHVIVNIPPQAHLCEKKYINWLYVGLCCWPLDYEVDDKSAQNTPGRLRIVHSPSKPKAKGTPVIREAVERLKQKGIAIDYIELINVPNKKVIEEIRRADLVIDQMYADYAMPGFATEAAWQEKPVLIAGYAAQHWRDWMAAEDLPPTHYCHPDDFEEELYRLATDPDLRSKVAREMYEFVSTRWSPKEIAQNYLQTLDNPPPEWWLDPNDNRYLHGCCISEEALKTDLAKYVRAYGEKGLFLRDKPALSQLVYEFAKGDQNH